MRIWHFAIALFTLTISPNTAHGAFTSKDICKGAIANKTDVREKYLDELFKQYPIPLKAIYLRSDGTNKLSDIIFDCKIEDNKCQPEGKIKNALTTLLFPNPEKKGDYSVKWRGPFNDITSNSRDSAALQRKKIRARAEEFLDLSSKNYELFCTKTDSASVPNSEIANNRDNGKKCDPKKGGFCLTKKSVSITKNTDSIGKDLSKKEAAEIAFSIDKEKKVLVTQPDGTTKEEDTEILIANFAVAYSDFFNTANRKQESEEKWSNLNIIPLVSPFVQLEYKSDVDATKETDNLSFGIKVDGDFPIAINDEKSLWSFGDYRLTGSWITDIEERESSQWLAALNLPVFALDKSPFPQEDELNFRWFAIAEAAFDYSDIGEVGDKMALEKLSSFSRYGYDLRFLSRLGYGMKQWSAILDTNYKFRKDFSDRNADADLLEIGLILKPRDDSKFSYGLKFQQGQNLSSLEDLDSWQFTLGYTQ